MFKDLQIAGRILSRHDVNGLHVFLEGYFWTLHWLLSHDCLSSVDRLSITELHSKLAFELVESLVSYLRSYGVHIWAIKEAPPSH